MLKRSVHKEDIKAEIRKRHGSLAAFEAARGLPRQSTRDVLRGRAVAQTAHAIAVELNTTVERLFPAKKVVEPTGAVMALSPNEILIGDRLGAFHPDKAQALGQLMAEDGQIVPIIVRASGPRAAAPWTLIAGHHRLEGARMVGLAVIDAIAVEAGADALQIEAMENAARPSRSPLERASFVRAIAEAAEARLKEQHGDLSPQQIGIRKRWDAMKAKAAHVERDDDLVDAEADYSAANFAALYGWQDATADAMGFSKRSLQADLALHRALIAPFPTLWRGLATHPTVGENASALRDIAAIGDLGDRQALIESLVATPDMTLAQAMDGLGLSKPKGGAAPTGATKFMNNTTSNLVRLSAGDQARIAPEIVKAMKPSALLALRAALDARIAEEGIGE
ncbi:hypothetical protein LTR94_023950 [Friedmanniomyces endolithicus]|nr:hypothetical protein LTR94_023950 [Friedmanniomyces endolithicus]